MPNIYRLALQVQDASNPNGVVHSLEHEVMPAIRQEPGYAEQGTAYVAKHPAFLLFLDKLVSMTGVGWIHDSEMRIADAYSECHDRVDAESQQVALVAPETAGYIKVEGDVTFNPAGGPYFTGDAVVIEEREITDEGYAF